jgi:trk system potassium uptake protein
MNRFINPDIILRVTGRILLVLAAFMLSSVIVALIYGENILPFIYSILICVVIGGIGLTIGRKKHDFSGMTGRDGYLIVTISWILMSAAGAMPYLFSGSMLGLEDAFFESVSGFTTTGSSILTDIEALPKSILFWRSMTHWIGGIGIIVLVIVIMPGLKMGSMQLFSKESSLQEKFQPRTKSMGLRLLYIYLSLTAAQTLMMLFGGMNLFESLCHSFGTVATGGFSPKNTSIAEYSPYIQYVTIVFMFLAGTNFVVHYYIFKGNFKRAFQNEELRFYFAVTIAIGLFIGIMLFLKTDKPFELAMRESFFQVVSIITCTGFATADYLIWPQYLWIIIFFAMFLGGSTGSTAGGIKMGRHLILMKNVARIFKRLNNTNVVAPVKFNGKILSEGTNSQILGFIAFYILVFITTSVLLILLGVDIQTSAGSTATCMAGIGPGIGSVGPVANFAHLPQIAKIILSFTMIMGRLELLTVFIIFTPAFWRS